ncbi:hypothetical protein FACS1894158_11500 [Betaproteobacteria bacterium]|nr:hypothetical protein FACS1894158_11500 [Betaproteobacteria bacterium]
MDGSDPAHAAKRARYLTGNVGSESKHSNVSPLFRDNEELLFPALAYGLGTVTKQTRQLN